MTEQMRWRLRTQEGKERYKLRKQTVEPVFGIIKEAMGFRQFHLLRAIRGTLCPKYVGENAVMAKATAQIAVGTEAKRPRRRRETNHGVSASP